MNGAKGCMKAEKFFNSSKYGIYVSVFSFRKLVIPKLISKFATTNPARFP